MNFSMSASRSSTTMPPRARPGCACIVASAVHAAAPSAICVSQKLQCRFGSGTNRSASRMTQAAASSTISGRTGTRFSCVMVAAGQSLLLATCASRSVTDTCITSMNGFGHTPIQSTSAATNASSQNSRRVRSVSSPTWSLATAP